MLDRAFGAARCPSRWSDADVRTLLAKFGLPASTCPAGGALSPGERTRAALALCRAAR